MLQATLDHLASADHSGILAKVAVVENGGRHGSEAVCGRYASRLPILYLFEEEPNSGNARNVGVAHGESDFILFLDDDVRIFPTTLRSYHDGFERHGERVFLSGPVVADYEEDPNPWLMDFLPPSAGGLFLGDEETEISKPIFLGGNLALPRKVFEEFGPFDSNAATGKDGGGLGEETRLQRRMLSAGVPGIYLPRAGVWHFVPKSRCDEGFIVRRNWRVGWAEAVQDLESERTPNPLLGVPRWYLRSTLTLASRALLTRLPWQFERSRFVASLKLKSIIARFKGYRAARAFMQGRSASGR
jgi:GT2 family glycosyltransferase